MAKAVKPNHKLKAGQLITILLPKPPDLGESVVPENIPLDIRYEDDDLLIVYKPAGMVVHPGVGNPSGTLVNALAYHLQQKAMPVLPGNSPDRPGLVHRIDKDTSGLVLIAKNDYTMTHLAKQFFDHTIKREYNTIVWGAPDPPVGTIEGNIGRDPKIRQMMTFLKMEKKGRKQKHITRCWKIFIISVY
jgi:23S rRNA pseudouridine1911/1915/1917 synthase